MTTGFYLVLDCPWNRTNHAELIGQRFENPPSYCAVQSEREGLMEMTDDQLKAMWNISLFGRKCIQVGDGTAQRLMQITDELLTERGIDHSLTELLPNKAFG